MKIICIGRNYKAHIQELNNDLPEAPVVFFKPASSLIQTASISIPSFTKNLHFECELILKMNRDIKMGTHIGSILEVCGEWTLGIDFTGRDMQDYLKAKGLPWELAKGFDNAALIGTWIPIKKTDVYATAFHHYVNNHLVQNGHLGDLIFGFEAILNYCLQFFSFQKGDVLFTGTPEGVAKVKSGDVLQGIMEGEELFRLEIE